VTSSLDGTARLWDANSGAEVAVLSGHVGPVNTVDFALDGTRVVTTGSDRTIRVWDATTGDQVASLPTSLTTVTSLVVAPDGSMLAAIGSPATVEVWDVQTATLLQSLDHGAATSVTAAAFGLHDDAQILVTGDDLGVVRVWDPRTADELAHWDDLIYINDVSLAENGSWVVIGSYLTDSLVWDWASAPIGTGTEELVQLSYEHSHPFGVRRLSASPDGTHLASVGDRAAALWNVEDVRDAIAPDGTGFVFDPVVLRGHATFVSDVAWSPDGSLLATADLDGRIRVWDGQTGSFLNELAGHHGIVLRTVFRSDGALLSISDDRTARLWHTSDDVVFRGHTSWVNAVALHGDASTGTGLLVSAGADGLVVGSDAGTGQEKWRLSEDEEGRLGYLQSVAISPDGQYVAAGGLFGIVDVWRVNGGEPEAVAHWSAGANSISSLSFDPTGARLAVGLTSGTLELWPWQQPDQPIRSLIAHHGGVVATFNADGTQIATGGLEGGLRIWSVGNGALIKSFVGHDGGVGAIALSADGRQIVSGGWDRAVRITDIDSGDVTVLSGHEHPVSAVALDDATGRIVSGDAGGFVGVWDMSTGDLLSMRHRHEFYVNGIVVSNVMKLPSHSASTGDDLVIFSAGDDKVVRGYGCTTCGSMVDIAHDAEQRIGFLPQAADPVPTDTLGSDLTAGTCSDDPGNEFVRLVPVDCELPHDLEYFAAFEWPDPPESAYPADIDERGVRGCEDQAEALFGSWPSDVEVIPFQSTAEAWTNGGRHVQCAFKNLDGSKREGSLVATGGGS
jgi:WD40 repeat protein